MKSAGIVHHRVHRSLAALFALGCFCAHAQADRPAAAVETSRASLRDLAPSITATGQVQSRSGADMAAGIGGPIDFVAEPGTRVKKDEVIARIDTGEIRLQRAEQAARVTRSELALKQADRELERLQASGNAVSRYQLDQAQNTRDLARSDLDIARAALRQTDDRLARAEVRAPFAGVIAERVRRQGEEVARGDAVARLQDTEHLELRLFLPLRHVRAIAPGSSVQVRLDDERVVAGKVRAIVPVGDARSQSFETLIDLPAAEAELAVGRTLQVVLPLSAVQQVLAVPRDALVIRSDGLSVYVVRKDKAERVPVKTGSADGDWVAVQGALAAQDAVVVRGAETLHDGDPVKIIGEHKTWNTGSGRDHALSQP
jgi:RND family efflux transporter MFP subunit